MTQFEELLSYNLQSMTEKQKESLRKKKVKYWKYPIAIEKKYKNWIKTFFSQWIFIANTMIVKKLNNWIKGDSYKRDEWTDDLETAITQMENLTTDYFSNNENKNIIIAFLIEIFNGVSNFNEKQFIEIVSSKTGIIPANTELWMSGLEKQFINDNINLIQGLTEEYRKKIQTIISNGMSNSESYSDIAKKIRALSEQFDGYRADLIARDQIGKLDGELQRMRQQDIGVVYYIWRTMKDERVRSTHKILDGKYCDWRDHTIFSTDLKEWKQRTGAMYIGQVGADYQCRCYGEGVYNELLK